MISPIVRLYVVLGLVAFALLYGGIAHAKKQLELVLLTTVEIQESGLLADLLPRFKKKTGITVNVIPGARGPIQKLIEKGAGDVLLIGGKDWIDDLLAEKQVIDRKDVLYTDLVVVGPKADPAGISGMASVIEAFAKIAAARQPFVSRADGGMVHRTELELWQEAGFNPEVGAGEWYQKSRKKMSLTLKLAALEKAYTLSGLASWMRFGNKKKLAIHVDGDPRLQVQISALRLDPKKYPKVHTGPTKAFLRWLASDAARKAIAEFAIEGEPVYYPQNRDGD